MISCRGCICPPGTTTIVKSRHSPVDPGGGLRDEEADGVEHVGVADLLGVRVVDRVDPGNGNLAAVHFRMVLMKFSEQ